MPKTAVETKEIEPSFKELPATVGPYKHLPDGSVKDCLDCVLDFWGPIGLRAAIRYVMIETIESYRLEPIIGKPDGSKLAGRILPLIQNKPESIPVIQDSPKLSDDARFSLTIKNGSKYENRHVYASEFTDAPFACDGYIGTVDPGLTVTIVLKPVFGSMDGGRKNHVNAASVKQENVGVLHPVHGGPSVYDYKPHHSHQRLTWTNQGWKGKILIRKVLSHMIASMQSIIEKTGYEPSIEPESGIHNFILNFHDDRTAFLICQYAHIVDPKIPFITFSIDNCAAPVIRVTEQFSPEEATKFVKKCASRCIEDLEKILDCIPK